MSVTLLPFVCGTAALIAFVSLIGLLLAVFRRQRLMLWCAVAGLVCGTLGSYGYFLRLERIHRQLFRSEVSGKKKADLLTQIGPPSRIDSYVDKEGRTIEVWFYDITVLQPPVHTQFQFYKEELFATVKINL